MYLFLYYYITRFMFSLWFRHHHNLTFSSKFVNHFKCKKCNQKLWNWSATKNPGFVQLCLLDVLEGSCFRNKYKLVATRSSFRISINIMKEWKKSFESLLKIYHYSLVKTINNRIAYQLYVSFPFITLWCWCYCDLLTVLHFYQVWLLQC